MLYADSKTRSNKKIFNNWSLNLCKEEIKFIHDSNGMIGIILDKNILGSNIYLNELKKVGPKDRKKMYLRLIWENIFFIVEAVGEKKGWDLPVFASDFDGLISQIEFYPSCEYINHLREDLINFLYQENFKKEYWFDYSPNEIGYKVFTENAIKFIIKNYNHE